MDLIRVAEAPHLKRKLPEFRPGDTVRVHAKVIEGDKERVQVFEGTVIARGGRGIAESCLVRRVSYGVGIERGFLIHSPKIAKVEVMRTGKARRAKLFYLRDRGGKDARITEERTTRVVEAAPETPSVASAPAPESVPAVTAGGA